MSTSRDVTAGHCRCPEGGIFDRLSQFCLPVHVRFAPKPHLGVKVARPETPVVSISGDGGFLFGAPELATAVRHGIAVTAIVFNDGAYGNVKRSQELRYGNRLIAWDLANPDFVRLGESFGIGAHRAPSPEALRRTLERSLASNEPALIEVPVGEMPSPWPFIDLPKVRGV